MAAIMFVDVVESVRHVQRDEPGAIRRMRGLMALAADVVPRHQGRVIERLGDGLVLRFDHARQATQCAQALHDLAHAHGARLPEAEQLQLRAGIHSASIWEDASGLYGLGVSLAARVAAVGGPGDTVLSAPARDQLVAGLDGDLVDMGECFLKHVAEPMRLFRHRADTAVLPVSLQAAIAARLQTRPVLAILPFEHATQGPPGGTPLGLGDILADQLTAHFSASSLVHVISGLSANAFRGRDVDMGQLYKTLRADYVLRGQVLVGDADEAGGLLRLRAQLWRAGAGEPVHELVLQGHAVEVLALHSDLLGRLAHEMATRILKVELRAAGAGAQLPNLASHTLYLNAVALLHRFSLPDFERARQMLEALAERAPRHAEPLAWLARWHVFRVVQGWTHDRQRDRQQAVDCSQRALERNPESALALTMAGSVHAGIHRDPVAANGYYDQALRRNPNEALAWLMKGVAKGFVAQPDDALQASETAMGLSPMGPMDDFYCSLSASAALAAGALERAMALAQRAIAQNRAHGSPYRTLAIAAHLLGQTEVAKSTVQQLLAVEPQASVRLFEARAPGTNPRHADFAESLRAAGLPEE